LGILFAAGGPIAKQGMIRMKWTMEKLTDLSTGYWAAAALNAAVSLGIFDALADGRADAAEIAKRIGCSQPHTERLLRALAGLGLLEQHGAGFAIVRSARQYLSPSGVSCLLDALRFNADLYQAWGRLADCVKQGRPAVPAGAHLGNDAERTRRFVMGMHSRAMGMAPALLPALDVSGCGSLLDVGAGPGTFARLLAVRHPALRVTLYDLEPVLAVARELESGSPASGRIEYRAGDYRKDELPAGFDGVLYCGALHQEDPDSARVVLGKLFRCLEPGGCAWIVDLMLDDDLSKPPFCALFSITMMLTSPSGRVFAEREVVELASQAGFSELEVSRPAGSPYRVVKGRKS